MYQLTDDEVYAVLPSQAEDELTVPNSVNVGIAPTPALKDDNEHDGQPITMMTLQSSVSDAVGNLTDIIETIGGGYKTVNDILNPQDKTAVTTAPVVTPPPTNYTPLIIAGVVVIAAIFLLKK